MHVCEREHRHLWAYAGQTGTNLHTPINPQTPTHIATDVRGRPVFTCVYCIHESSNPEHGHTRTHENYLVVSESKSMDTFFCRKVAAFLWELIEGRWGRHGTTMNSNWSASHFFFMSGHVDRAKQLLKPMPTPHAMRSSKHTFNPIMKFRIGMNLVHFGSFWCWLWLFAAWVANQLILGPTTSDREVCASWFQGTASRKQTDPLTCSCPVCFHFLDTFDSRKCRRRFGQA